MRKMLLAPALVAALSFAPGALSAHDFWSNGERVDPRTKSLCCGNSDHFELSSQQVAIAAQGFRVRGRFVTSEGEVAIDQTIPAERAQPSPDGKYHIHLVDGLIRCFFAPLSF